MGRRFTVAFAASMLFTLPLVTGHSQVQTSSKSASSIASPDVLTRDQASALMPSSVFFKGRIARVQARNTAGLRLNGDHYVLVAMVDTSGYASSVQESYQAYLITEVPLSIESQTLAPGAYGIGFIAEDHFVCSDLGGNFVVKAKSLRDIAIVRPNPLQIIADSASPEHFRLYSGRSYITFSPGTTPQ